MFNAFCFICFAKTHRFQDCVFAVPNLFLPNIDQDLLARFVEFFEVEEKFLLIFSYPNVFAEIKMKIKPVKIMNKSRIVFSDLESCLNANLVIASRGFVQTRYFDSLKAARIAFRIEQLNIISPSNHNCLKLSPNELFFLLTYKTKTLLCKNIEFYPKVNFCQIVEAATAVEEIDIYETNIEVDDSWVDLLSKLQRLKTLSLTILNLNVNVANLAAFIEAKKNNIKINLFITVPPSIFDEDQALKDIENQLSPHFFLAPTNELLCSLRICFKYDNLSRGFFNFILEHGK